MIVTLAVAKATAEAARQNPEWLGGEFLIGGGWQGVILMERQDGVLTERDLPHALLITWCEDDAMWGPTGEITEFRSREDANEFVAQLQADANEDSEL